MRRVFVTAVLVSLLLVAGNAFGQGNAQVSGSVQDPSKALIPGVTVTLTNTATGVISTQVSNESGVYTFASVPPGAYKLTGSLPGFKTAVFNDVAVGTSAQVRLNITMQLGEVTSQVEVSVSKQQLLTESSASIGEVLTQQRVSDLPMVRGDVLDLVRIMPGMRVDPFGDQFSAFTGLPTNTINTTRDGLSVTDTRNNVLSGTTTMSPDLVGEIRIILSPVDAEFGRGNGQIQIQTRSGSNKFTGSAVWNIRNTGLASNSWLNNRNIDPITKAWSPTKPDWRNTHDYTVSYGGPIVRNKTFFFALWDQQISRTRTLVTNNVLTDTARQGIFRYYDNWNGGDSRATVPTFPASLTAGLYPVVDFAGNPVAPPKNPDGSTYNGSLRCYSVFGNTKADGTAFTAADCAGGVAMIGSAWDPLRTTLDTTGYIKKLLGAMPRANYFSSGSGAVDGLNLAQFRWLRGVQGLSGGGGQNGTSPESVNRKQLNIKIDHNFSTRHRLSAGWTYQADDNGDNTAAWPGGFNGNSLRRPQVLTLNFTSTVSPTIVNEARYGISYQYNEVNPPWNSNDPTVSKGASDWLLQGGKNAATGGVYPVAFTPGAGNYSFASSMINNGSTYSGSGSPLYNYADTLSWTRGSHAFRMGGELRMTQSNGYSGNVFPTASGGNGNNASPLVNTITALGPNQLATTRTNASNMLYFLAGSVNGASMLYWVGSPDDTKNGTWQDYVTAEKRNRKQVANEWDAFFKDDWKVRPSLTLNLGVRYEFYGSPYLKGGYTASVVGQGAGLFGVGRSDAGLFDKWMAPGNIYLSGYGPNATAATALQCTSGAAQNALLPTPNCDPTKLTGIEYVGPGSDHPNKTVVREDRNNFGPAIGFAWQVPWFGKGKTNLRGGFSVTYGVASRNAATTEGLIGNVPGSSSTATTALSDFPTLIAGHALNLGDLAALVPVRPTSPALPGGQIKVYDRATGFTAYDPNFSTPFTENITLSITRTLTRNLQLDVRYDGTLGRKRQGTIALNTTDVYYNRELLDALEMTRRGENAPLFDQMFAGLNLAPAGTAGYGPIGTCVTAPTGTPGLGAEGCSATQVFNHGSAHLRRNAQFTANIANGNFNSIAGALNTLSAATVATGVGALQSLPTGVTGVSGRVLRNGCDRIAANLYNPAAPASATNIPTRCFPENYIVANPQLSTASYSANLGSSNYHSLQTQFTLRPIQGVSFQTTYIWAKTLGLVIGGYTDPLNRNADYAPPYQAVKHDLRTNGTFEVPIGPNKFLFANSSGWAARLIERWQMSFIANASSGNPRTIIGAPMFYATGNQNLDAGQNRVNIVSPLFNQAMKGHMVWDGPNHDTGTYYGANTFVTGVADPQCALTNKTDTMGFNLFSSCTLSAVALKNSDGTTGSILLQNPTPGTRGNMPFSLEAPGKWKFDMNLGKTFRMTEHKSLQVRMDAVNILNHPDIVDPDPQTGSSINTPGIVFGRIQTKSTGGTGGAGGAQRSFQGQLRFTF